MKWQQLIVDMYETMFREIETVLEGLTPADLRQRPSPGANPIGWLCWHTVRSCDRFLADVALGEQLWIKDGWHKKFNLPPDPNDTGFGHTDARVDALGTPDVETLLGYGRAVAKPLLQYLEGLTEEELDRGLPSFLHPGTTVAVGTRLAMTLNNLQHVGQAGYVRGMIKGHRWSGR